MLSRRLVVQNTVFTDLCMYSNILYVKIKYVSWVQNDGVYANFLPTFDPPFRKLACVQSQEKYCTMTKLLCVSVKSADHYACVRYPLGVRVLQWRTGEVFIFRCILSISACDSTLKDLPRPPLQRPYTTG